MLLCAGYCSNMLPVYIIRPYFSLGFAEVNYSSAFKEYEYALTCDKFVTTAGWQKAILGDLRTLCNISSILWNEYKGEGLRGDVEQTVFNIS